MSEDQKYYLSLYQKWMNAEFPFLCHFFERKSIIAPDPLFELFKPTIEELREFMGDGYSPNDEEDLQDFGVDCAWGCLVKGGSGDATPLRQNIILFMAAMNGEL